MYTQWPEELLQEQGLELVGQQIAMCGILYMLLKINTDDALNSIQIRQAKQINLPETQSAGDFSKWRRLNPISFPL
jgi:hypothetical protein